METITQRTIAIVLALFLILSPTLVNAAESVPEQSAQPAEPSPTEEAGYGFASGLASLFYTPAKLTYAGLGLLTGGLGYLFSGGNADVANHIIYPSVGGNYVVTPKHIKGEEPLIFVGAPPEPPREPLPAQPFAAEPTREAPIR
ncbi:MAG: hypothetical protein ACREP8_01440 [Candidatus Binatia bacterium]